MVLGIDTSCYTTSVAIVHEETVLGDFRRILKVKPGERGLRQSEGFFQHVGALPELLAQAAQTTDFSRLDGIAVSVRPRPQEDSYMPVFTAGKSFAQALGSALKLPVFFTSHQEGHVMAALKTCGEPVEESEFVSVHLSGGTTELLRTVRTETGFSFFIEGRSLDLHAGQLIDRTGVLLGMDFPCGKEMDRLAMIYRGEGTLPVTLKEGGFHLSGAETKAGEMVSRGEAPEKIAYSVLHCIAESLEKMLKQIYSRNPFATVILAGGVSASQLLRRELKGRNCRLLYAEPAFAADNAAGTAWIGEKLRKKREE